MEKTTRKFSQVLALLLAVVMIFSACGNGQGEKDQKTTPTTPVASTTIEPTPAPTQEATTAEVTTEAEKATEAPTQQESTEATTVETTEKATEAPAAAKDVEATTEAEKATEAPTASEKETEAAAEETTEPEKEETKDKKAEDEEKEIEQLPPITIGLATDTGGVDDKSFNQGTWEGVLRYAKDQNLPEEDYQYVQATSDADYIPQLTTYADMGKDIIIAPGFLFQSAILEVAQAFPDEKFLFIDDVAEADNIVSAVFAEHEGSFLVGVAAGLKADAEGKTKVGFVGGMDFETIQKFESGYIQGVHAVNPDIEVVVEYVGAFDRPEDAQAIATKMFDSGVYIIYHAAGGSGNGVIKEAKDRAINGEDVWVIGVDKDQYEEGIYEDGKSVILTSMIKRVDNASYTICTEVAKGEFKGGIREFTLADDGLAIPEENPNLEDEWVEKIEEFKEQIVSGEIEVDPVPERVKDEDATEAATEEESKAPAAAVDTTEETTEEVTEAATEAESEAPSEEESKPEEKETEAPAEEESKAEEEKETEAPTEEESKAEEEKETEAPAEEESKAEEESEPEEKELKLEDFPQLAPVEDSLTNIYLDEKPVENMGMYTMLYAYEDEGEVFTYDSNYVRLNDLAALFAGTDAKFNVEYSENDDKKPVVTLTTGEDYKVDEEKDLVERDRASEFTEPEDVTYIVDGEELEDGLDAFLIDDDYYVQIGSIRRALKGIYHNNLTEDEDDKPVIYYYPYASDIPVLSVDEFQELLKGNENTYVWAWATWCYWCHQEYEMGHVDEIVKYAEDHDLKIINLLEDYDNVHMSLLEDEIGIPASDKFVIVPLTSEIADYFTENILKDNHPLWFPTIFLLDSEGEPIIEYSNGEDYTWVELLELAQKDELQPIFDARAAEEAAEEEEEPAEETAEETTEEVTEETTEAVEETKAEEEKETEEATEPAKETEEEAKDKEPAAAKDTPEGENCENGICEIPEDKKAEDEEKEIEQLPPITIGLATDTGGVDDKSFNQGTWEGVLRYAKDQNLPEEDYQYVQATSDADYIPQLTTYADMGKDIIIAPGFLFQSAILEVAQAFPDEKFLFIDDVAEADNIVSAVFAEHEGSFLVGVAAGLKADAEGKTKVGFVGGMDFETIQKFESGYIQGVHAVNPDIEVVVEYVGAFDRPEDAQAIATKMFDSGVYIIYHAAGGSGNGVIKEAKDRAINGEDVWVIGVDKDQYEEGIYEDSKSVILTSMIKRVDNASYTICTEVAKGEFKGGIREFTLADDGLAIPEENPNLEDEWVEKIEEFKEKIVSGEIEVDPVPERVKAEADK